MQVTVDFSQTLTTEQMAQFTEQMAQLVWIQAYQDNLQKYGDCMARNNANDAVDEFNKKFRKV